jgi:hypothetical protein
MTESELEIDAIGNKRWYNKPSQGSSQKHRVGGPAVETHSVKAYYIDGQRHRLDGPAVEWTDGLKDWWVNGRRMTREEFDKHPLVVFWRLSKG